ncbi:acetyltransferase [Sporomusa malonica]|uniref:acetyltransferase n=1 Tax=Sporomusa malonica TaxID=112901 RepID=UPI002481E1D0|nr:acetyltransferase [Sporomusa malonica]
MGSGGHAKVVIDIIEKQTKFNIVGLIDGFRTAGIDVFGYKILGDELVLESSEYQNITHGIVAIGDNWVRNQVVNKVTQIKPDFKFIKAIHPSATIAKGVIIGEGTVVMAGSIINSDTKIGKHCIINTNSSLDHDNSLGNYVNISPGAVTGGNVIIDDFSTVSLGAKVIHKIIIGAHSLIGAGAVVVKNIESQSVWYGVPAKFIRKRNIGERYL